MYACTYVHGLHAFLYCVHACVHTYVRNCSFINVRMYVLMYLCMVHVYLHVGTYVRMYLHACVYLLSCSGHGLPAGLAEVEMIERARAKREWLVSILVSCPYIHTYVRTYSTNVRTYVRTYSMYLYMCTYVRTCVCSYLHTYMHTEEAAYSSTSITSILLNRSRFSCTDH